VSDRRGLGPVDRRDPLYWVGSATHGPPQRDTASAYPSIEAVAADTYREALLLMLGRHRDYGPLNIANAYPDPLTALIVRMSDKMERIKNILRKGEADLYGERMRDSWLDLGNYALIGVMNIDGNWPGNSARNQMTPLSKENDEPLGGNP